MMQPFRPPVFEGTATTPTPGAQRTKKPTYHEAMQRYHRQLTEWNRLSSMGRAHGMPPAPPRFGVDYE
jgi:hypothetical protein